MQAHSAKIVTLEPGTMDVIHEENIDIEYVQKGDIVKVSLFVCLCRVCANVRITWCIKVLSSTQACSFVLILQKKDSSGVDNIYTLFPCPQCESLFAGKYFASHE